jgi:hypothetical protein
MDEIAAAGLPAPVGITGSGYTGPGTPATAIDIFYDTALTGPQKTQLDGVVAAHVPRGPRKARPLWSIRADIQALTPAQFNNVWADLSAAVPGEAPRKYLTDYGANAAGIFVFDWSLYVSGPTAAQVKAGQISLTSLYCQDNWSYLVHPPFDSTINIDGSEPVP